MRNSTEISLRKILLDNDKGPPRNCSGLAYFCKLEARFSTRNEWEFFMFCINCGVKLDGTECVCPHCGKLIPSLTDFEVSS